MNKRTLIIPDLHLRWRDADEIIKQVAHDEIIFLGDYFDDFNDTPDMNADMGKWLNNSVKQPNRIHLFGNHDIHYAYPYRGLQCSGYTTNKNLIISDIVDPSTWNKLKFFHVLDNSFLLSHAGLHRTFIPKDLIEKIESDSFYKELEDYLTDELIKGLRLAASNKDSWILGAGRGRGGRNPVGGIIWCDFNREFEPIGGLNQIFGHTPLASKFAHWCILNGQQPRVLLQSTDNFMPSGDDLKNKKMSFNLDLDVWKNLKYVVWNGSTLTVGDYNSL